MQHSSCFVQPIKSPQQNISFLETPCTCKWKAWYQSKTPSKCFRARASQCTLPSSQTTPGSHTRGQKQNVSFTAHFPCWNIGIGLTSIINNANATQTHNTHESHTLAASLAINYNHLCGWVVEVWSWWRTIKPSLIHTICISACQHTHNTNLPAHHIRISR